MSRDAQAVLQRFLLQAREPGRLVRTDAELLDRLSGVGRVITVNLYELRHYVDDPVHRARVDSADAWTADGWPVVRALAVAGVSADRVTGSGLTRDLLDLPEGTGPQRVAVLGSDPATVESYRQRLTAGGRELVLSDTGHRDDWTPAALAGPLRSARPDLLLVAVGTPWGVEVAQRLQPVAPCSVIAVGAGIGMAVEAERRAPELAQRLHLEWGWRLAADPRRLWRRYVVDCLPLLPALRSAAQATADR